MLGQESCLQIEARNTYSIRGRFPGQPAHGIGAARAAPLHIARGRFREANAYAGQRSFRELAKNGRTNFSRVYLYIWELTRYKRVISNN